MTIPGFVPHYNILALLDVGNGHEEDGRFIYDLSESENRERATLLARFQTLILNLAGKRAWFAGVPPTNHVPWRKVLRQLDAAALNFLRKTCTKEGRYWVLSKNRLTLP